MNWTAVDHYFTLLKHDWPKCHSVLRRTLLDPALRQFDQVMSHGGCVRTSGQLSKCRVQSTKFEEATQGVAWLQCFVHMVSES